MKDERENVVFILFTSSLILWFGPQQQGIASGLLVLTGLRCAADPLLLKSSPRVCR